MIATQTKAEDFRSLFMDIKRESPFIVSVCETKMLCDRIPSSIHILCDMPDNTRHCYTINRDHYETLHLSTFDGKSYKDEVYKNTTWCDTMKHHKIIRNFLDKLIKTADYFKKDLYGYTAQWYKK